jgi:hypothetical protein
MAMIRWSGFLGENRALHPKLLGDAVGTVSRNQNPSRGDLRPWRNPKTVATVPAGRQTIYRMGRDVNSESQYWLSWTGRVHAMLGFEAENPTERTYYSGDGAPKVTDNTIALTSTPYPTASRPLGLPAPATALLVTKNNPPSGSSWQGQVQTYFYTYTYVNDWGWESAPAPPSLVLNRETDATANITGIANPPAGNYQINKVRIYRTQSGSAVTAEFFFLKEVALGTTTVVDDNPTLGEVIPTKNWAMPPSNLSFLTPLWNGMAAGIADNAVRFSEPFATYAWPPEYDVIPPDGKPVGLGVFGQALLVLTTGRPLLVTGSTPESMDQAPMDFLQSCVSPPSIVSMGAGVAWASDDGLCFYGTMGPRILTAGVMTREDWQAIKPATIVGKLYEGLYFGTYDDGSGTRKAFMINPVEPSGIFFLDTGYPALHFDELQDQLYVLNGTNVQRWDAGTTLMTYRARSKLFHMPKPLNMASAEVVADAYPVTARFFADGVLKHTQTVTSRDPFRLPSGFRAFDWQVEVEGQNAVQGVAIATSVEELSQV